MDDEGVAYQYLKSKKWIFSWLIKVISFLALDVFLAFQAHIVKRLIDPLHSLIEPMIDFRQLALTADHDLLCLVLALFQVIVAIFLQFLQQSTDC